jgi:hypothetical protein
VGNHRPRQIRPRRGKGAKQKNKKKTKKALNLKQNRKIAYPAEISGKFHFVLDHMGKTPTARSKFNPEVWKLFRHAPAQPSPRLRVDQFFVLGPLTFCFIDGFL